jgi:signal transduction histidine kinase
MVMMQDVTDERRAEALAAREAALSVANRQLDELSRAKSELLSIVSHEVRTPLVGIRGFSEMIRDDTLGRAKTVEYASLINAEARRLGRLVDDLLDFDRLETGRAELRLETVDLRTVITDSIERARPTTNVHRFAITLEEPVCPATADRDKLMQIMSNLISNAIKYSPNGGLVTVGGSIEADYAHLWVRDEGDGIPPEALEAIFDRYVRIEVPSHKQIAGIGLGLPIVRHIAALHGGRVWAESEPGRGATFHVVFPVGGPPAGGPISAPDRVHPP